ncbi:MAG: 23S rRNA (guanosine(2251)-2'-O)-methyltransferase RlmB [Verrucomicrobia bacterium]|nr:23S rRNA (guanosine(2251)-2'-O)-methyltransferase RlmB [Verrucomicrobiota bacterium]MDA1066228.1 23S rRNA (guanosine(2251)-2'-O)-methyltransferase RlmB [Verrucomicrobiota bacterium]
MARRNNRSKNPPRESKHVDINAPLPRMSEEELYEKIIELDSPTVLILDCIEDPHNLGACLRTADAVGVIAVVTPKNRAASITETVRRVASGGAESVPVVQVSNLAQSMTKMKDAGLFLIGTSDQARQDLYDLKLTGAIGIVMGSEGNGLRRLTMDTCDDLVKIPMEGNVPCLNISVATGVCLYEVVRQRKGNK